jgi:hypothetical protein
MEKKKRIIKYKGPQGMGKRAEFPKDFETLIKKVQEFMPLNDNSKRYQFIEEKAKREITSQEDYEIMSKDYINENVIRVTVNIVDKNTQFIIPDFNKKPDKNIINEVSNEASINFVGQKKETEMEEQINQILKLKMKELEDNLTEELYSNLKNEISKSKIQNKASNNIEEEDNGQKKIHRGITCNKCGKKDFKGKRYKCAQCSNFNLCEKCENNYIHDMKHIMIRILNPLKSDNELNSKINKNIAYKNQDMNYNLEPKIFNLDARKDTDIQQVKIINTGITPWRGAYLKFVDKSEIIGEVFDINYNVNSGSSLNAKITFNDLKNQINSNKKIYYCFLQMFNKNGESFGNITKIKVHIKN